MPSPKKTDKIESAPGAEPNPVEAATRESTDSPSGTAVTVRLGVLLALPISRRADPAAAHINDAAAGPAGSPPGSSAASGSEKAADTSGLAIVGGTSVRLTSVAGERDGDPTGAGAPAPRPEEACGESRTEDRGVRVPRFGEDRTARAGRNPPASDAELAEPGPSGPVTSAFATAGIEAMAAPTPSATANMPNRAERSADVISAHHGAIAAFRYRKSRRMTKSSGSTLRKPRRASVLWSTAANRPAEVGRIS